jgi:purine-binding chemotaxis protein CheW
MDMQVPEAVRQAAAQGSTQALAWAQAQAAGPAAGRTQVLSFTVAGATYAMAIGSIKEIIEYGNITTIPLMPAFIRGVINLRGAVLPVVDLATRLGFAAADPNPRTCVLIVEMHNGDEVVDLGVVVDGVSEVLDLAPQDLEPPPSFGANIRTDFIQAMARIRGRFVIVMRLAQVLSIAEMSSLARLALDGARPSNA